MKKCNFPAAVRFIIFFLIFYITFPHKNFTYIDRKGNRISAS